MHFCRFTYPSSDFWVVISVILCKISGLTGGMEILMFHVAVLSHCHFYLTLIRKHMSG